MNPRVTTGGSSFKGAFLYYMHDKCTDTRERIAWTHTENMLTDDPDLAWKVMSYTAKNQSRLKEAAGIRSTGRKCEKPVMAYSLSWHPEQNPDKDHMLDMALKSLDTLGLSEHECLIVAHRDTPHKHVHIMVNLIHPVTGVVASNSHSYRKLSAFALEYAREHELEYCPQREENAQKREKGETAKYTDNRIQEAWDRSDNGRSFMLALDSYGLTLAHGRKRLVVVDKQGKTINPVRHIEGIRAKDLRAKLSDIDLDRLPDVEEALERKRIQRKRKVINTKKRIQEIRDHYKIDMRQRSLNELQDKLDRAPWWKKLFGLTRRDKTDVERLREEQTLAKQRADKEIRDFKAKVKRELLEHSRLPRKPYIKNERQRSIREPDIDKQRDSRSRGGSSFEFGL